MGVYKHMTTQTRVRVSSHWQKINMGFAIFAASCVIVGTLLVAAFLFASVANAQETADVAVPPVGDQAGIIIQNEPISDEVIVDEGVISEEVLQDEQVTRQDLGAKDAAILPDSPLHIFKRFGRGLKEALTFDPVKKAEVKLQHATQEIFEAKKLIETKGVADAGVAKAVIKSTERFEAKLEDIAGAAIKIKTQKKVVAPQVDQLVEKVLDRQMKVEKVQDMIEEVVIEKATEADLIDFKDARERAAEHVGVVLTKVEENTDAVAARLNKVAEAQEGSSFKEFKNIEVMKKIADTVPESAKEAFEAAEQRSYQRLQADIEDMPEEVRAKKLVKYTKQIKADDTRLLEISDQLKRFNLPEDVLRKIEEIKDIAVNRIKEEMEVMGEKDKLREKLFARLKDSDDFEDIRMMEEINSRMRFDEDDEFGKQMKKDMERHHKESASKFMDKFKDADSQKQAEKFKELTKKMAENPDPATFRALMKLEEEVRKDPAKAAFVDEMKAVGMKTQFAFEEKMKRQGDFFLNRIATSDPRDLEVMREFGERFAGPPMMDFDLEAEFGEDFFIPPGFMPPPPFMMDPEFMPPGMGPEGFGPPPFDEEGFMPPGMGPEGFGPPPFLMDPGFGPPLMGPGFDPFAMFETHQKKFLVDHVAGMEDADAFHAMESRFRDAAPDIVNEMQQFRGFKDAFNDKAMFVQEMDMRRKEEDLRQKMEIQRFKEEQEFFKQIQNVTNEEERQRLMEEKQMKDEQRFEKDMKMQKDMMQQNMRFDPFCDDFCQQQRMQMMDKQLEQAKGRFSEFAEEQSRMEVQRFERFEDLDMPPMPPGMGPEGFGPPPFDEEGFMPPGMGPEGFGPPPFVEPSEEEEGGGFFDRFRGPESDEDEDVQEAETFFGRFRRHKEQEGPKFNPPPTPEEMGVSPVDEPYPYMPDEPYTPPVGDKYTPPTDSGFMPPPKSKFMPDEPIMPPDYQPTPTKEPIPTGWEPISHEPTPYEPAVPYVEPTKPVSDEPAPIMNEPEPYIESAPVFEPAPIFEPEPYIESAPVFEPAPIMNEPEPYIESAPVFEPLPAIEPMEPMKPMEPAEPYMEPMSSIWKKLAGAIYNFITLPARAFGL